jgi:hypothetical protein
VKLALDSTAGHLKSRSFSIGNCAAKKHLLGEEGLELVDHQAALDKASELVTWAECRTALTPMCWLT